MTAVDTFASTPTTSVYDVFAETASQLVGRLVLRMDRAESEEERAAWWARVMEVRDARRTVPARDRDALLEGLARWTAEIKALEEDDASGQA